MTRTQRELSQYGESDALEEFREEQASQRALAAERSRERRARSGLTTNEKIERLASLTDERVNPERAMWANYFAAVNPDWDYASRTGDMNPNNAPVQRSKNLMGAGNYFDFSTGKAIKNPNATQSADMSNLGSPFTNVLIDNAAKRETLRVSTATTITGGKRPEFPAKPLENWSSFKEFTKAYFARTPESTTTTTSTFEPRTTSGAILLNTYFYPKTASGGPIAASELTSLRSYTMTSAMTTEREGRLGMVFRRSNEGLASTSVFKGARWLGGKMETNIDPRERFAGRTLRIIGEKPVTSGVVLAGAILPAAKGAGVVTYLARMASVGLGGEGFVKSQRRMATERSYGRFYSDQRFMRAVSSAELGGRDFLILPYRKSQFSRVKDYVTLKTYGANVEQELRKSGYAGDELKSATAAAVYEKRTRQRSFEVGAVLAGEGAGNLVGGYSVAASEALLRRTTLSPMKKSVAAYGLGIGVGGFAEGSVASVAYDVANERRVSYRQAAKSGAFGALMAGSVGAGLGYARVKWPNKVRLQEETANLLDAPAEQLGDISSNLIQGKYNVGARFGRRFRAPTVTPSFSTASETINVKSYAVRTPSTRSSVLVPTSTRTPTTILTNVRASTLGSRSTTMPRGLVPSPVPPKVLIPTPAIVPTTVPSTVPSVVPSTVPSIVPTSKIGFPFVPWKSGGGFKWPKATAFRRQTKKYRPSVYAIAFNIRGRAPKGGVLKSGLTIRPIISSRGRRY